MKKTNNTKLINVGQLVKELEGYGKKHWDWNVEISTNEPLGEEEDLPCIIIGMELDKDGDLRIDIEDEWAGGGDYYVGQLIERLREFDSRTQVYLAGGGLLFSIDNHGSIFSEADDDTLSCCASSFGEYECKKEEFVRKEAPHTARRETIALTIVTAVLFIGLCYNIYALAVHSTRHAVWEHILGIVGCIIGLVVCGASLYFNSKDNK